MKLLFNIYVPSLSRLNTLLRLEFWAIFGKGSKWKLPCTIALSTRKVWGKLWNYSVRIADLQAVNKIRDLLNKKYQCFIITSLSIWTYYSFPYGEFAEGREWLVAGLRTKPDNPRGVSIVLTCMIKLCGLGCQPRYSGSKSLCHSWLLPLCTK